MPQIWMTYTELAGLMNCPLNEVRPLVIARALKRKHSSDGETRAKLDAELSWMFVEKIRETPIDVDTAVAQLRRVHCEMAEEVVAGKAQRASR
jgi:hypothetical protein